jgi:hypothetical protein
MYFGALSLGELCLGVHWQIRSAKAIQEFVYSRLAVGPIESLGSPFFMSVVVVVLDCSTLTTQLHHIDRLNERLSILEFFTGFDCLID